MLTLHVSLLSGRTVTLEAKPDHTVESLQVHAQTALNVCRGRLLDCSGDPLDAAATVEEAGLQTGQLLTLQMRPVEICSSVTGRAFAAILSDGSVATWGLSDFGGDSSAVQDQLRNV
ncbi:unnamed protein product [Symbiodinium natans]|uniref:Ubiquitin-like domain-containing protein n=1 Tax=Symbiodinium natans TaxID=878477 RepID=A0A812RMX1_9DINO|nr:unnamed protein product [Symbiodinium natans]